MRAKGEGSIRKRKDGRWGAAHTIGVNENGNPKRKYVYAKTEREVLRKLRELQHELDKGTHVEPSTLEVGEWLHEWIDGKKNVADSTRYKYKTEVRPLVDLLGGEKVQELKPFQIRSAYSELAEQGVSVRGQKKAAMHLRSALRDAKHLEIISRNPAEGVEVSAPRTKRSAQALSKSEVNALLASAKDDASYPILYLLLALGLRRGEALGIAWGAVDLNDGSLRIRQQLGLTGKGNKPMVKQVKTPHSRRTLYFDDDVGAVLASQERVDASPLGLVFTTSVGTPVHPRNLYRSFKRIAGKAGLDDYSLHDLRHTHASLALQSGVPPEVVSARLGHASVGFTLDQYRHLYEPERRKAALSLDQLVA